MKFRDYQEYAINSIFKYFEEGGVGDPIVAMPTGTGKSLVIGGFIQEVYRRYPNQRIIKLTHVKELISQNLEKLLALWPTAPAGVYSAGLGRKEIDFPITYAGIASVAKVTEKFGHVDLILIDECHLLSPNAKTMYRKAIDALREVNPNLKVIGLTATAYRLGQGSLIDPGGIFTDICVDMTQLESFNWFIEQGYLAPLIPRATHKELSVEGVRTQHGEFNAKDLQEAVNQEAVTHAALLETLDLAQDRDHWLVFASGIDHAKNIASMLDSMGVSSVVIHSKMPDKERDQNIADFKAGKYKAMVNNGILTTGFDYPEIDLIVMLRPTQSPGLWVQMLGRGTRPVYVPGFDLETQQGRLASIAHSPKQNCLVLDFAGNTRRLGPINDPVLPKRKGKKSGQPAPVRVCENCYCYCHASVRVCPQCGFNFPKTVKIFDAAGSDALIATKMPVVEPFKVDKVVYRANIKQGRPTSLKVSYFCGLRKFDEWVCLEHHGYPRHLAHDWWRARSGSDEPPPTLVDEAIARIGELQTPSGIMVWLNKKYPEVLSYEYGDKTNAPPQQDQASLPPADAAGGNSQQSVGVLH